MGDPLRFVMTTYEKLMGLDKEEEKEEKEDSNDERVQVEESEQDM